MILIVEDDAQVARLISLVLQRHGFQSETVDDGGKALERIRDIHPSLVFADLQVRGMGGEALCHAVRSDPSLGQIPFVIVSGDRDLEEKAKACGANAHLGKPFEFDDLVRLVNEHAARNEHETD